MRTSCHCLQAARFKMSVLHRLLESPACDGGVLTHHHFGLPRCHQCILAARSEYFRALLERSLARGSPGGAGAAAAGPGSGLGSGQGLPLPEAVIGGISAGAFETVLRFVYTDSVSGSAVPGGPPGAACDPGASPLPAADACGWLDAESAEELLFAADLFLLFSLKVCAASDRRADQEGELTFQWHCDQLLLSASGHAVC